MNNDPLVTQMQQTLAQRGYVPPNQATPSAGSDWYTQVKQNAPPTPAPEQPTGLQAVAEIVKGGVKGLGDATVDAADVIGSGLQKIGVPEGTFFTPSAKDIATAHGKLAPAPNNNAQSLGHAIGEVAPYVGDTALDVAKGIPAFVKGAETVAPKVAKVTPDFIKGLITPELSTKATADAIKTGKVQESTGLTKPRDISKSVPFFDEIHRAVSEVPNLSPEKTLLENANAIHDHIGTVANDLVSQLKQVQTQVGKDRGFFTPNEFKGYLNGVKDKISENPTITGDAETSATKILTKFSSLVKENGYTPEGLLNARKSLDSWMSSQKGDSVFDPKTEGAISVALRAIRQGGNDFLAHKVPDVAVKDLLGKQTSLFNAIENIAPRAAKEGATGFEQFVKAHPIVTKAAKLVGNAAGLGAGIHLIP